MEENICNNSFSQSEWIVGFPTFHAIEVSSGFVMFHVFSRVLGISVCSPLSLIKTINQQTSQSLTREPRVRRLIPCPQRKNVT
jgi:hypothetical protein